jgi:sigma-B regulation protein RsbU (phosphoserine phosphatase)
MMYHSLAMLLIDTQLTASEVLRAFHRDEPYLFLGAAFSTVAWIAGGFCILRRRWDALLVWMAIFAHLYGQRLWLDSFLLRMSIPDTLFLAKLRLATDFLIPIPGFIFFQVVGFIPKRGKAITAVLCSLFGTLVVATFVAGPLPVFHKVNDALVIIALPLILFQSLRVAKADRDFVVLRRGLLVFVALAMWDNTLGDHWDLPSIEPYGFAVLLGCLGYVAARRTLERDVELGEIHSELELARRIQLSILPACFPASADFRVAARYIPMTTVAGDMYDFLETADRQAGLLIADVSGHGIPGAFIAAMVKMAAASQRVQAAEPARMLTAMNAALCGNTQGQYVTAAYVHLDATAGELRYAAAGHPAMLLLRQGMVTEVAENGLPLAVLTDAVYSNKTLALEAGDRLMLYTDGLVEARNARGELFGEDRLSAELLDSASLTADAAADRIVKSARQWAKLQEDDLTLLVCDYVGAG